MALDEGFPLAEVQLLVNAISWLRVARRDMPWTRLPHAGVLRRKVNRFDIAPME